MIQLKVNGRVHSVDAEPTTPLLWVLREQLGLTGTKYGCGVAQCGSCSVHIDGEITRSCVIPVSAVGNRRVTTIEGVSADASHPVQKAWLELDVPSAATASPGRSWLPSRCCVRSRARPTATSTRR